MVYPFEVKKIDIVQILNGGGDKRVVNGVRRTASNLTDTPNTKKVGDLLLSLVRAADAAFSLHKAKAMELSDAELALSLKNLRDEGWHIGFNARRILTARKAVHIIVEALETPDPKGEAFFNAVAGNYGPLSK